jgi:hypothetical protein
MIDWTKDAESLAQALESEGGAPSLERLTAVYLNATGVLSFGIWPDRTKPDAAGRSVAARLARAARQKALAAYGVDLARVTGVRAEDTE